MATWLVGHAPWFIPARTRLRLDVHPSRLWLQARSHLNVALQTPSPASLEVETMPYPTTHPDTSVFEPMSEEYAAVSTPGPHHFTPLSSSETLASLVFKGDFRAADTLRKEMIAHHMSIPRDALYLRAALHAITRRPSEKTRPAKERLDAFEAWLSLTPDRHEKWQSFHDIRQRLFRSMDHLNLTLVYRFGLVLASKGYYSGDAAMQVVSMLARYAQPSVVEKYLQQVEQAAREYHLKMGTDPPSSLLAGSYSLSIRTVALAGKGEVALTLISIACSRGIQISDFTLNIVAKHAPNRQAAIDRIQVMYPVWTLQDTNVHPITTCDIPPAGRTTTLAANLRSLRNALRSPIPPSPHDLMAFIISCQAHGRTRAFSLLRALAYRHSPKSAGTWAFTEMLLYRRARQPMHLLFVFAQHFYLVGVPHKTLLSIIRGPRGQQTRKERDQRWMTGSCSIREKLWPSAYHTALVWEAVVSLSPKTEKERLYALLLTLVRRSRQSEPEPEPEPDVGAEAEVWGNDRIRVRVQLPPDTYDAAHFSPFVAWWASRRPARAADVLRDMIHLGIEPTIIQWSIVARGYAQHDDPGVALRILDRLEETERGKGDGGEFPSDALLGVHTNVLRGFATRGDVVHAREVEKRLVGRLVYRAGDRPATDSCIRILRALEESLAA